MAIDDIASQGNECPWHLVPGGVGQKTAAECVSSLLRLSTRGCVVFCAAFPSIKTYSNQWIDFRDNLQESPIGLRENLWFPVDFHLNQSIYSKPVTHLMVVYCWVYHNTVEYKWSAKGHFKKNRWMRVKRGPTLLTAPNHAMKNMMNFRFSNKLPSGKLT